MLIAGRCSRYTPTCSEARQRSLTRPTRCTTSSGWPVLSAPPAGDSPSATLLYARVFDKVWVRENMPDAELRRQRAAFRRGLLQAAGVAAVVVAVVATLAVMAKSQANRAVAAELESDSLLAKSQADRGRMLLRDGDMHGLLHLAQARETADDMPELAESIAEEWALWHWGIQDRLMHVFGHDAEVTAMAFSPDGSLFLTASEDGTAQLWNTASGRPVGEPLVLGHVSDSGNASPALS